jgi:hypothetical protein
MKHQLIEHEAVIDGDVFFSQLACIDVLLIHILMNLDTSSLFMLYITSKMTHSLIDTYSSQLEWNSFTNKEEQVDLLSESIECHYLEHVKFYVHRWPHILDRKNMYTASRHAVKWGALPILRYFGLNGFPIKKKLFRFAARYGHLNIIIWLKEAGYQWDERTCLELAKNGHLDELKWVRNNKCPWDSRTCSHALNLEILQWARMNGCPWDQLTLSLAALNGKFENLKWAMMNGCPSDANSSDICDQAAGGGQFHILKWLIKQGYVYNHITMSFAAKNGDLEMVQYLYDKNCTFSEDCCTSAALGGQLKVLQYLREKNCPWDEYVCVFAARCHHLNVLKWAIENGCPHIYMGKDLSLHLEEKSVHL